MKKHNTLLLFVIVILVFSACEKAILGEDESNDPENNYELFWNDFDVNYGLFEIRGWDWDSIYSVYRPQITPLTTDTQLWEIMTETIEYLDDGHTFIYNPISEVYYESGNYLNNLAEDEFDLDLVKSKYTDDLTSLAKEVNFLYGKLKNKNIGYIYLDAIDGYEPEIIDEAMAELTQYEAIVFDLRNNGGGDDAIGERIAGAFADKEALVYTVEEKIGSGHNDFSEKIPFFSKPVGYNVYLKHVIILTDRYTVSAAETFLIHMNSFDHIIQMGDTTAGDFSDTGMLRFLPNGWVYQYSIMQYLLPNGESLDGIGHIPDVYIKNSQSDIEAGNDLVLEKAIQYLFDNFGIE